MKVRATFLVDKDLLKKFKTRAINEEKSYSELLEELIKKKLNEK
ncbi:MAG: hypothetical protein QW818_03015 [Candidatus Aenigmatarchaeota archaeon]